MGRGMKIAVVVGALVAAVVAATYFWYGSLDPCDWTEQDMADRLGSPRIVARAAIHTQFLLDGITEPTFRDCLSGWWKFRTDDLPANS